MLTQEEIIDKANYLKEELGMCYTKQACIINLDPAAFNKFINRKIDHLPDRYLLRYERRLYPLILPD